MFHVSMNVIKASWPNRLRCTSHENVRSFLKMASSKLIDWFYIISTCFNTCFLPSNPQQYMALFCQNFILFLYIPSDLPVWFCSSLEVCAGAEMGCRTPGSSPKVRIPSRSWYCPGWMSCRWATEWTACGRKIVRNNISH